MWAQSGVSLPRMIGGYFGRFIERSLRSRSINRPYGAAKPHSRIPKGGGHSPKGPSEHFIEGHSLSSRIATCSRQCQALRHSCTLEDSAGHCSHSAGQSQAAAAVTARPLTRTKGEGHPPPKAPSEYFIGWGLSVPICLAAASAGGQRQSAAVRIDRN